MDDADGAPTTLGTAVATAGETIGLTWAEPFEIEAGLATMVVTPLR